MHRLRIEAHEVEVLDGNQTERPMLDQLSLEHHVYEQVLLWQEDLNRFLNNQVQ